MLKKDKSINKYLIKKHFRFQSLTDMQKHLYERKNTEENKKLVILIEGGLSNLEKKIEEMSESKIKNKKTR